MFLSANHSTVSLLNQISVEFAQRMFQAARDGNSAPLLQAVDAGLPVNMTNDKGQSFHCGDIRRSNIFHLGNTLLMLAAYAGHAELTDALLSRKADPNRLNDLGQSIVAGAVFKANDAVVHSLMRAGADPRKGTPNAIQTAHMFGRKDLMEILGTKEEDVGIEVPTPPSSLS